jgi:prenyltransferase/squalene oxidase-like repeat protein
MTGPGADPQAGRPHGRDGDPLEFQISEVDEPSRSRAPSGDPPASGPQPIPKAQPVPAGTTRSAGGAAGPVRPGSPKPVPGQKAARPILVRAAPGAALVREHDDEDEPEEELSSVALKHAPPWLVSAAVHMVLMIFLGLLFLPSLINDRIELSAIYSEDLGDQLVFDSPLAGNDDKMVEDPILTPDDLRLVEDPFAAPPEMESLVPDGTTSTSDLEAINIGMALDGREEGTKRALLSAYGGNATTEAAVQAGLKWLAKVQQKDGSWSLIGKYSNGALSENRAAATAMALLAFQGNGHTHRKGDYKRNVASGWKWLLSQQGAEGDFFRTGPYPQRFYTEGQCTIALCELYGMSKDERFREPAERAVRYCVRSQGDEGGWRYMPRADSDVSVTGWILMALQSARMAGLGVPTETLERADRYLDSVSVAGGSRYPYQKNQQASNVMTAEGLLCRQYLGWKRDDPRLVEGVQWLLQPENLIGREGRRDVYYWYYATQTLHHMEGEYWKRWNNVMRQVIPEQQVKVGREKGSWDPIKPKRDRWVHDGGRLFVTCLSIYMLEVYYRHLPIYSSVYRHLDKM